MINIEAIIWIVLLQLIVLIWFVFILNLLHNLLLLILDIISALGCLVWVVWFLSLMMHRVLWVVIVLIEIVIFNGGLVDHFNFWFIVHVRRFLFGAPADHADAAYYDYKAGSDHNINPDGAAWLFISIWGGIGSLGSWVIKDSQVVVRFRLGRLILCHCVYIWLIYWIFRICGR